MVKYFDVNVPGHSIRCKLFCHNERSVQKVILFGHGFGGHKDNKAAERFANRVLSKYKSTAVLIFNWPCHGDDVKKKMSLTDCDTYITSVLQFCREHFGTEDIAVHATSFGGYLYMKYIHDHGNPFRQIVLRCPALKMHEVISRNIMGENEMRLLEKGKEAEVGFDRKIRISAQFLKELEEADVFHWDYIEESESILILHGTKDEVVPMEDSRSFCDENLIEFIPIENADHRFQDPTIMDKAIGYTVDFLKCV